MSLWARALACALCTASLAGCASSERHVRAHPSLTSTAHPSSSVRSTTTSTLPPAQLPLVAADDTLPTPKHSPLDPYDNVPVRRIGTISIPRIGLVHPIYEGIWLTVLNVGPGHWPGSALPGELGNTVFPGHRVTHSHPFLDLDVLRPGDEIIFDMPYGRFTYRVTGTLIVRPDQSYVVDQHNRFEVTLVACHPKHSAVQRIVVQGRLVRREPSAAALSDARRLAGVVERLAP